MPSVPHDLIWCPPTLGTYIIAALGHGGDLSVELVEEAAAAGVEQGAGRARVVEVGRGDGNKAGHGHNGGKDAHGFGSGVGVGSAGVWVRKLGEER